MADEDVVENIINISRKQARKHDGSFIFETDEFQNEISAVLSIAATAGSLVYDVPTGKKFHLRYVGVAGNDAIPVTYTLFSSSATYAYAKHIFKVASAGSYDKNNIKGPVFAGDVYVSKSTHASAGRLVIGGILDPIDDGR